MAFLNFDRAEPLIRRIALSYNIRTNAQWTKFCKTKQFKKYEELLPKRPWVYYSKKETIKRKRKSKKSKSRIKL